MSESTEQPSAESVGKPGIAGMMLVKAPLDAEKTLSQASDDFTMNRRLQDFGNLWTCFFNGDRQHVFGLNAVA